MTDSHQLPELETTGPGKKLGPEDLFADQVLH